MPENIASVIFKTKKPKVAVLIADGYSTKDVNVILDLLIENGAKPVLVTPKLGMVRSQEGDFLRGERSIAIVRARDFDAVYVPSGIVCAENLRKDSLAVDFISDAFMHHRVIGASGSGAKVVGESHLGRMPAFSDMLDKIICGDGLAVAANGSAYDIGMDFIYSIAERLDLYQAEYSEASA